MPLRLQLCGVWSEAMMRTQLRSTQKFGYIVQTSWNNLIHQSFRVISYTVSVASARAADPLRTGPELLAYIAYKSAYSINLMLNQLSFIVLASLGPELLS